MSTAFFVKRLVDLVFAAVLLGLLSIPMLLIALFVRLGSAGPALYWSKRVGRGNAIFRMPKYRTMRVGTPPVATHLLESPERFITAIGRPLRRTSLDELPQLFSVLKGDMSFVGPRPALFNQRDLIALRTRRGIHCLRPGITGWAQVNGRDELPIPVKVWYDEYYLRHRSMRLDFEILRRTALQAFRGVGVSH
jgi:O-antigen biosynthesis protein WbqP